MIKFIELHPHLILSDKSVKKQTINIDAIVELEEVEEHITRIHLISGKTIDIKKSVSNLMNDMKSLYISI